jgi:hypothetical protein
MPYNDYAARHVSADEEIKQMNCLAVWGKSCTFAENITKGK